MIAYMDASALVKRYVAERWAEETREFCAKAEVVATSVVSRAEVGAALAKAVRLGAVQDEAARKAQAAFARDWPDFARIRVTEALVALAGTLALEHALRGYDAVQLAAALSWQESIGTPITLAAFDRQLWEAGKKVDLQVWPEALLS